MTEKDSRCPSNTYSLILLKQGLLLNLELAWQPASASNPPVSPLHSTGTTGKSISKPTLFIYMGAGDSNLDPHACMATTVTH